MKPIEHLGVPKYSAASLAEDCPYCIKGANVGVTKTFECLLQEARLHTEPCTLVDLLICRKYHSSLHSKRVGRAV